MKIPNFRDKFNLDLFAELRNNIGMTKDKSEINLQQPVKMKVENHTHPKRQISASYPHFCQVFLPSYVPVLIQHQASFNTYKIQSLNYKPKKYYKHTTISFPKTIETSAARPSQQDPTIPDILYHLQNFNIYKLSKAEIHGLPQPDTQVGTSKVDPGK